MTEPTPEMVDTEHSNQTQPSNWPTDIIGLLAVLTTFLLYFQYTSLQKFSALRPAIRYVISKDSIAHILSQVDLTWSDAFVFGFIVLVFFCIVVLEIWRRRLTDFLQCMFKTERRTIIGLLICSLVLVRYYFAQGVLNWSGDGSSHICYSWLASQAISQGELPIWTNYLATGSPYLQFYGFLFFYLVGVLNVIVGQLDWSMKLIMASAHVISGLGIYLFVRRLCGSRQAGFVSGLAFVVCVWHMQQTLIMGRFPLSLFYALLPWPFYCFELLRFQRLPAPAIIGGGFTLGLMTFVHPGYAFWAAAALALYIGTRALIGNTRISRSKLIFCGLTLWISGLIFGAYLTLPMWMERALVDLEAITHSDVPDPTWGHLFVWSNYRLQLFAFPGHDHWYGGYLGISLVMLALIGLYGSVSKRHRSFTIAASLCFIVSFILVLGYRWPGIRSLEIIGAFNAGRYLLFVTFFLAVMAGVGTVVLRSFFKRYVLILPSVIVLIILIDLGPTTFQHPYVQPNRTFMDVNPQFYTDLKTKIGDLPSGQIPNFRASYPMHNTFYLLGIAWYTSNFGIPSFLTGYREGPKAQSSFAYPIQGFIDREFQHLDFSIDSSVEDVSRTLKTALYLLNNKMTYTIAKKTGRLITIDWPHHSPIVVAPEIRGKDLIFDRVEEPQRIPSLIYAMDVDIQNNTCQRIFVNEAIHGVHLKTNPEIEITAHRVWNQKVELDVVVSASCFARLAYAHYPYLSVFVDGKPVTVLQTAGDFIAIKLSAGEHRITLQPHLSPLRRILLILNVVLLIVALVLLWKNKKITQIAKET